VTRVAEVIAAQVLQGGPSEGAEDARKRHSNRRHALARVVLRRNVPRRDDESRSRRQPRTEDDRRRRSERQARAEVSDVRRDRPATGPSECDDRPAAESTRRRGRVGDSNREDAGAGGRAGTESTNVKLRRRAPSHTGGRGLRRRRPRRRCRRTRGRHLGRSRRSGTPARAGCQGDDARDHHSAPCQWTDPMTGHSWSPPRGRCRCLQDQRRFSRLLACDRSEVSGKGARRLPSICLSINTGALRGQRGSCRTSTPTLVVQRPRALTT